MKRDMTSKEKYRICKTCGNRNHPRSGQCPWCGARLHRPIDWLSRIFLLLIVLILVGLVIYSRKDNPPSLPPVQSMEPVAESASE